MTLTWENLQERRRKWRESKTGWRDKMREAQEQRRLEQIYFHRSTPWTRDEHGNDWRQVGDVDGQAADGFGSAGAGHQRAPHRTWADKGE